MKILVIGFPKTGTKSMHAALQKLGYEVYHYEHNFYYLRREWMKIFSSEGGTKEDFYNMYKDVDATMDVPSCVFWREILEAFPEAKLIFNDRKSEQDWWISGKKTRDNINNNKTLRAMKFLSPTAYSLSLYDRAVSRITLATPPMPFWQSWRGVSPTVAKLRYRNHNAGIREYRERASKDQFLTFHPSEGWEPLCKFLGKPIPDEKFPHKNIGGTVLDEQLQESPIFYRMKQEMMISLTVLTVIVALVLGWFFYP